jgi:hypothetical protein
MPLLAKNTLKAGAMSWWRNRVSISRVMVEKQGEHKQGHGGETG